MVLTDHEDRRSAVQQIEEKSFSVEEKHREALETENSESIKLGAEAKKPV